MTLLHAFSFVSMYTHIKGPGPCRHSLCFVTVGQLPWGCVVFFNKQSHETQHVSEYKLLPYLNYPSTLILCSHVYLSEVNLPTQHVMWMWREGVDYVFLQDMISSCKDSKGHDEKNQNVRGCIHFSTQSEAVSTAWGVKPIISKGFRDQKLPGVTSLIHSAIFFSPLCAIAPDLHK